MRLSLEYQEAEHSRTLSNLCQLTKRNNLNKQRLFCVLQGGTSLTGRPVYPDLRPYGPLGFTGFPPTNGGLKRLQNLCPSKEVYGEPAATTLAAATWRLSWGARAVWVIFDPFGLCKGPFRNKYGFLFMLLKLK